MRKDSSGATWRVVQFADVPVGCVFKSNGNAWRKRSTRTAVMVSPSRYAGQWFYFNWYETAKIEYEGAMA